MRNPFPEPPPGEVCEREPGGWNVVLEAHSGHIETASAGVPAAHEELRLLLSQQRSAGPAERHVEAADLLDQAPADSHVDPKRVQPPLLEHEWFAAVIENRQHSVGPPAAEHP